MGEAVIVAGIGSRRGVATADVVAAVEHALEEHGLEMTALSALATTAHKRGEKAIFEAGERLGLPVIVVELLSSPPVSGRAIAYECAMPLHGLLPPPLTPPHKGEGELPCAKSPSPLWGGTKGGGKTICDNSSVPGDEEGARAPTLTTSPLSLAVAGTPSVSEAAALAAAGQGAKLLGPRTVLGPVTCAIAMAEGRP